MDEIYTQLGTLPKYLSAHLVLSFFALCIGIVVSVPLGVFAIRKPRFQSVISGVVAVIQTIPSLALLALMVPLLGGTIGWKPALIALTLYSMLPILANTITGLKEVDPRVVEAGRAVGMTDGQLLWRVMLPLALPVIVAGIRTSVIWVVGTATLATPVGGDSLGYYIFFGLNTRRTAVILMGCVFAALLAIVLDSMIANIEGALKERHMGRAKFLLTGLLVMISLGVAAPHIQEAWPSSHVQIANDAPSPEEIPATLDGLRVVVGSKNFTESYILAELLKLHLERYGVEVELKTGLGSKVLFDSVDAGTVDIYVDYSGTIWATVMKRTTTAPPQNTLIEVAHFLLEKHGITVSGALGFENAYALAMSRKRARELKVRSLEDLAKVARQIQIAGDFDFFGRAEGKFVLDTYGLQFQRQRSMSSRIMYDAVASGSVDVVTAYTTDGQIAALDLLILDDPKGAFPAYDAMVLLSGQAAENLALVRLVKKLNNRIDNDLMRSANKSVDLDGAQVSDTAKKLYARMFPVAGDESEIGAESTN